MTGRTGWVSDLGEMEFIPFNKACLVGDELADCLIKWLL
jgi:hypothetical protein